MNSAKNREKDKEACFNELFQGILASLQKLHQLFLAGIFVRMPCLFPQLLRSQYCGQYIS